MNESRVHAVAGGGGLKLHVREVGPADGPAVLFLHGWSQSHLAWMRQLSGPLARTHRLVAVDLRGHGASEAPPGPAPYRDGAAWADDVAAIVAELNLTAPVLVGWSYGGLVIGDYLRRYGDAALGGVVLVGAIAAMGRAFGPTHIGPGFTDHAPSMLSEDHAVALPATAAFLEGCFAKRLPRTTLATLAAANALVRPDVRRGLFGRTEDFRPEYAAMRRPLLVLHGRQDTVVLPRMAEDVLASCLRAEARWYDAVGHGPFLEVPRRFDADLAGFVRNCPR